MIYILHGTDSAASYNRLKNLEQELKFENKIILTHENSEEDFFNHIFTKDLFLDSKLVICHDFLLSKKIKNKTLEKVPTEQNLFLWETNEIPKFQIAALQKFSTVEKFNANTIFEFLDQLNPRNKRLDYLLTSLNNESISINWALSNRFLLLILIKLGFSMDEASHITQKIIFDWQWQKLKRQANDFETKMLKNLFSGLLKIDYLIKSGATSLKEKDLIPLLFLKYLPKP